LASIRLAILGDKMSDMEAGAAAGIGLRVLIGARHAKTGELPYEVVADLSEALTLFRSRFAALTAPERSAAS
jgi:histidinol phosphatase-like enzyme